MLYHLVYVSSTAGLMTKSELLGLLEVSRRNNARLGVTGMLLYRDGNVLQVLEGEADVVKPLYHKISQDPRHRGTIILTQGEIRARDFPSWEMAFRDLAAADTAAVPGYSDFLNTPLTPEVGATRAIKLLSVFKSQR